MEKIEEKIEEFEAEFVSAHKIFATSRLNGTPIDVWLRTTLSQVLKEERTRILEEVKKLKRKKGTDDYVLRDQNSWYNAALDDIKALLTDK